VKAPDMVGAVTGFRTWSMGYGGQLESLLLEHPWKVGEAFVADCALKEAFGAECVDVHFVPSPMCKCGVHSWTEVPGAWAQWAQSEALFEDKLEILADRIETLARYGLDRLVPGISYSWGKTFMGDNALRAQYSYPAALAYSRHWTIAKTDRIQRYAERYDLPVIPMEDLAACAGWLEDATIAA
jgi:hypothetical protein